MKFNEAVDAARRIGPLRALDGAGDPVLGEDFSGAGELEISVNGSTWAAAAGTIVEIGDGYYYYQATSIDASIRGFITVKLSGVCQETTFREDIQTTPQGIDLGTTNPIDLHVGPLWAIDNAGDPVLGEDFSGAGELEISVNGSTWAAAAGTIVEIGDGYYDYVPNVTEIANAGWLAVKIGIVCQETVFRADIVAAPVVVTEPPPPPTITLGPILLTDLVVRALDRLPQQFRSEEFEVIPPILLEEM